MSGINLDLAPGVAIAFSVGTEKVVFGPGAHAHAFSTKSPAEREAEWLDRARKPFLITVRGADGLIRAEWTRYAVDQEQAAAEGAAAAQREYGAGATVTAILEEDDDDAATS